MADHKKTWATEVGAFATAVAVIYQGIQVGVTNPSAIGDAVVHFSALASIAIPAAATAGRVTYKKWFRKPTSQRVAADRLAAVARDE